MVVTAEEVAEVKHKVSVGLAELERVVGLLVNVIAFSLPSAETHSHARNRSEVVTHIEECGRREKLGKVSRLSKSVCRTTL